MPINVSRENAKLGRIPNISFPPVISCQPGVPCADLCYARRAYEKYANNSAKPAWDENFAIFQKNPALFFYELWTVLAKKRSLPYFRYNVGGDIPPSVFDSSAYASGMELLAEKLPNTQFLVYTRNPWILDYYSNHLKPSNLSVVQSVWIGEKPQFPKLPYFKVIPKKAPVPDGEILCSGSCSICHACWNFKPGEGRVIYLH